MGAISVDVFKGLVDQGEEPILIDVRTAAEFRGSHISSACNLPLDALSEDSLKERYSKQDRIHLICQSGARSGKALQKLIAIGYANSVSIEGGMNAWNGLGYPVEEGGSSISIERQVRIAAGALVVLGILLALFIHIAFVGIAAFVGAGLVFAGITDTCGMGLVLARMPWNR